MLLCKNCGAPYKGGTVCEKCGSRFSEDDIRAEAAQHSNASFNQKNDSKAANIAVIIVALIFGINFLAILAAILVPAFLGYRDRARENRSQQAVNQYSVIQTYETESAE